MATDTTNVIPLRKPVEPDWTPEQDAALDRALEEHLAFALRDPLAFRRPTRKFRSAGDA